MKSFLLLVLTACLLFLNSVCRGFLLTPVPTCPAVRTTTSTTSWRIAATSISGNSNINSNSSEGSRNKAKAASDKDAKIALPFEDLESELSKLQLELAEQKGTYEQQLHVLEEESKSKVEEAEESLQTIVYEYETYKEEIMTKLDEIPSPAVVTEMEQKIAALQERTAKQESKLRDAKARLLENRESRAQLQGEMVALKHIYLTKLAEIEDALEFEQDERVREQQTASQEMEQTKKQYSKKLANTITESKQAAVELTKDFEQKLETRQNELQAASESLKQVQAQSDERQDRIAILEAEQKSLSKTTRTWLRLVRQGAKNAFQKKKGK